MQEQTPNTSFVETSDPKQSNENKAWETCSTKVQKKWSLSHMGLSNETKWIASGWPESSKQLKNSNNLNPKKSEFNWHENRRNVIKPSESNLRMNKPSLATIGEDSISNTEIPWRDLRKSQSAILTPDKPLRPKIGISNLRGENESNRALMSPKSQCEINSKSDSAIGVFILNIPDSTSVLDIISIFSRMGSIVNVGKEVAIEDDPAYAFVDFESTESVVKSIQELTGKLLFDMKSPIRLLPRYDKLTRPCFQLTPKEENWDYSTLYITSLPANVNKRTLENTFRPFGSIKRCHVAYKQRDDRYFGFITFVSTESAQKALSFAQKSPLFGLLQPLKISYTRINDSKLSPKQSTDNIRIDKSRSNSFLRSSTSNFTNLNINQHNKLHKSSSFAYFPKPVDNQRTPISICNNENQVNVSFDEFADELDEVVITLEELK